MFPANSKCLIVIFDAFLPFVYRYPSSSPRAHCTSNKSVPTLRYTRRHGPIYIYLYRSMQVGTYRVQSPGFPKKIALRPDSPDHFDKRSNQHNVLDGARASNRLSQGLCRSMVPTLSAKGSQPKRSCTPLTACPRAGARTSSI